MSPSRYSGSVGVISLVVAVVSVDSVRLVTVSDVVLSVVVVVIGVVVVVVVVDCKLLVCFGFCAIDPLTAVSQQRSTRFILVTIITQCCRIVNKNAAAPIIKPVYPENERRLREFKRSPGRLYL